MRSETAEGPDNEALGYGARDAAEHEAHFRAQVVDWHPFHVVHPSADHSFG